MPLYTKVYLTVTFLLFMTLSLFAQERAANLTIESFYSDENIIISKDYDARDFGDVSPYDPGDYLSRGIDKLNADFYQESLIDFNEAVELAPDCGYCYYYRGLNYLMVDSIQQSKHDYLQAINYEPLLIEAYNDVSSIYVAENNLDSAKYILKKGIGYFPSFALSYYNLGVVEVLRGKNSKAKKQFKKCLEIDPCHEESFTFLALIHLYNSNLSKAESRINDAIECNPELPDYLLVKSILKYYKGSKKAAIAEVSKAIEIEDLYNYRFFRGSLQAASFKFKLAIEDFSKAYELNPLESEDYKGSYSYRRLQRRYQEILKHYTKVKSEFGEKLTNEFDKGICKLITEDENEADRIFKKIIKKNKKNAFAYLLLGASQEHRYKYDLAFENYTKCLELDDKFVEALKRRGLISQSRGDLEKAIVDFNRMYEINPYSSDAIKFRGMSNFLKRDYKLALKDFKEYDSKFSVDTDVLFNIGQCYSQLGAYEKGITTFKRILLEDPEDVGTLCRIAELNYIMGRTEEVMSTCDTILSKYECHVIALNFKGIVSLEASDNDQALYYFNQSLNCSPQFMDGYINRSLVYLNLEKYQQALYDVNKAISIDPRGALPYWVRAQIKSKTGDGSACEDLLQAINLGMTVSDEEKSKICN